MSEQEYFYYVAVGDVHANGDILPPISQSPIGFNATAEHAQGKFFEMGYNLASTEGLFRDDGRRFVSEEFATTPKTGTDSVPNRLSVLFKTNPYTGFFGQFPLESMLFDKLLVFRMIQPTPGGKRSTRSSRRSRRSRRTNRK